MFGLVLAACGGTPGGLAGDELNLDPSHVNPAEPLTDWQPTTKTLTDQLAVINDWRPPIDDTASVPMPIPPADFRPALPATIGVPLVAPDLARTPGETTTAAPTLPTTYGQALLRPDLAAHFDQAQALPDLTSTYARAAIDPLDPQIARPDLALGLRHPFRTSASVTTPGELVYLMAFNLTPGTETVIAQEEAVRQEYRFCGPAVADAYGFAVAPCRVDPAATTAPKVALYEGSLLGNVLATTRIDITPPDDRIAVESFRHGLDLHVIARGVAVPLRETFLELYNPRGTIIGSDIVGTGTAGTWWKEWVIPGFGVELGRWTVAARQYATDEWATARTMVVPQVFGNVAWDGLGVIGFGFVGEDPTQVQFYDPDGRLAGNAAGTSTEGGVIVATTTPPLCAPPGVWTVRVWYYDSLRERQWVDVGATAIHGWCAE